MIIATCRVLATVGLLSAAVGHDVSKGAVVTQKAVTGNTGLATH
jgi:hypothetical protein